MACNTTCRAAPCSSGRTRGKTCAGNRRSTGAARLRRRHRTRDCSHFKVSARIFGVTVDYIHAGIASPSRNYQKSFQPSSQSPISSVVTLEEKAVPTPSSQLSLPSLLALARRVPDDALAVPFSDARCRWCEGGSERRSSLMLSETALICSTHAACSSERRPPASPSTPPVALTAAAAAAATSSGVEPCGSMHAK